MSIQQLLAQLSGMGLGDTGFGSSGQDVATALGEQYLPNSPEMLTQQMFQGINPALMKSASMGAYSPLFQQKQSSLMPQLMQQQQAKDVYGQGMGDVLGQAMTAKTQSLGTIQDIINQWQQTAQSFTGT